MKLYANATQYRILEFCPMCQKENPSAYARSGVCISCDHRRRRLARYNITQEFYNRMLRNQGSACAICKEPFGSDEPSIDHCHTTGIVRGLLCFQCNYVLGHAKDSVATLQNAIKYLRRNSR